jgi:hypothetical protein
MRGELFNERLNRVLAIEERITLVLNRRGRILAANGKVQVIQQGMFASPGGKGGRIKGALQGSAMIGGGFPLLFGQGGAGAALAGGARWCY